MERSSDSDATPARREDSARERLLKLLIVEKSQRPQSIRQVVAAGRPDGPVPLSYAQERLWFLDQLGLVGAAYNQPLALRLSGLLVEAALHRSFEELIRRHEGLRTRFDVREGTPSQVVDPAGSFTMLRVDLSRFTEDQERDRRLIELMRSEQQHRFDLSTGPLLRVVLATLQENEHALLLTTHHIVSDGWSLSVIVRELSALYAAFKQGEPSALPPLSVQYADFAIWQRQLLQGRTLTPHLRYWEERLRGAPPQLQLPTDWPRPAVESFKGSEVKFRLPAVLSTALKDTAQREGVTSFMLFLAAYQLLLSRWSGQQDLVVGSPIAARSSGELDGLIGFFVNMLVLRSNVAPDSTFRRLLEQVKRGTLEAYEHQDLPFDVLVKELHPERNLARQPIFQVVLAWENYPEERFELPELTWTWTRLETATTHFDLTLYVYEGSGEFTGTFEYATDLFRRETIERMASCFRTLLEGIVSDLDSPVGRLPLLAESDCRSVLTEWSKTQTSVASTRGVHELFEQQVKRTPDATAVASEQQAMTYAELNAKANQLARYLSHLGLKPDQRVAICADRSVEMVVGLLAVLKAGAAYLPLDPSYPSERLRYMLEEGAPQLVLTVERLRSVTQATHLPVVAIDLALARAVSLSVENLSCSGSEMHATNLVYVLFTSGSTGRPKGIAMAHAPMVNLIEWHRGHRQLSRAQRTMQFASLSFDVAFQEIFSTLATGGTLVLPDDEVRRDARLLAEFLMQRNIETLFIPPLMLQSLAECCEVTGVFPDRLRNVITAGEQLRISSAVALFFEKAADCRLHNHYGPTETHVVTALSLGAGPKKWPSQPSIGRPIANAQVYVLNEYLQPTPIGVVGEIFVGGTSVARGYLQRAALTAERFMPNPFVTDAYSRMYRTGDRGRWLEDGSIEYLGRNDNQVKVRGFRIELAEIETRLTQHEDVKEAAVIAREDGSGLKRLVAYVVPLPGRSSSPDALRTHLQEVLPEYMVPSAFVNLERMPLTATGKLDRLALPVPESAAYANQEYQAPQGEIETALARIWQDELQVPRVGRADDFFRLGGHSLLAVRLIFKINQSCSANLRVADVYKGPTIRQLAERIVAGPATDTLVDLTTEACLADEIVPSPGPRRVLPTSVMLTGATGFVGRFLLAQLMRDTDAIVYCLVRAESQRQGRARLRAILQEWELWRDEFDRRIVVIAGDLRLPRLGVDDATYELLVREIDSIYHCGTSMNHLETYAMARAANVESATELLKIATRHRPKLINYISTLGVFSSVFPGTNRRVDESSDIDHERHSTSSGYVASKWVAEKIFMAANQRGIPCNIFRLGFVWADTERGRYDELQREYRIIKSCLLLGCGIENYRHYSPPTPVDYVARALVYLAGKYPDGQGIFHISSASGLTEGMFERFNKCAGTSLKMLPFYEWVCEVKRLHQEGRSLPIVPLVEFAFSMARQSFYEHHRIHFTSVPFDCTRTHRELEDAGIVAPMLDDRQLRNCVDSMVSRDKDFRRGEDSRASLMTSENEDDASLRFSASGV